MQYRPLLATIAIGLGLGLTAQTPSQPKLFTYYRTATDNTWQWKPIQVDAPLTLTVDAGGLAHLTAAVQTPRLISVPAASPTLDATQGSTFKLLLDRDVSPIFMSVMSGQSITVILTQDSAGGHKVNWPATVARACAPSTAGGVSTIVDFVADTNVIWAKSCTSSEAATIISGPTRSAPTTPPPAGELACWFDVDGSYKCMDSSGKISGMIQYPQ